MSELSREAKLEAQIVYYLKKTADAFHAMVESGESAEMARDEERKLAEEDYKALALGTFRFWRIAEFIRDLAMRERMMESTVRIIWMSGVEFGRYLEREIGKETKQ